MISHFDLNPSSQHIAHQLARVAEAKAALRTMSEEALSSLLRHVATSLHPFTEEILQANSRDCAKMPLSNPKYDRLLLTESRLSAIIKDMRRVADLPSPLGAVLEERRLPNGLLIQKRRVPLGAVGMIYEARPNVTLDVFALCLKSGNVAVLKGGSDADETNRALVSAVHQILRAEGVEPAILTLLPSSREAGEALMRAVGIIDVIIPRGSNELIEAVRRQSLVPVIETGAGIVHTYLDESAPPEMASRIIFNAKTRRPSVCNALDTVLVHSSLLPKLPEILSPLVSKDVLIYADKESYEVLKEGYPFLELAEESHYGTEFLSLKLSLKTVQSLDEALLHISRFSSKHSEAIVSMSPETISRFLNEVDASVVYANTSTAFTDGGEFGMGAEIGISTQKLHARGPMALPELCTYKWLVYGNGQCR